MIPLWGIFLVGLGLLAMVIAWSYWFEWQVTRAQPPAGDIVEVPGGKVHVIRSGAETTGEVRGRRGKLPLVMVHGSTTNALDMKIDLAGRLAEGREILIPDRPGFGFSTRPPDGWRLDVQVRALSDAVKALGVERAVVLGQSFGGAVALRWALEHPEQVAGLVLVAPVSHPWPGGVSWYNRLGVSPFWGWVFRRTFIALYGRFGSPKGVTKALRGSKLASRYHARTRAHLTFRPRWFRYNNEDIVRLYEQLFAQSRDYDRIAVPVECLAGSHDMTVVTSVHARALARQIRRFNLEIVDGGGHALHHTHPEAVVSGVERMDRLLASGQGSPLQGALRRLGAVLPARSSSAPERS